MAKIRFILFFLLIGLVACTNEQGHYQGVGANGWAYSDTLVFIPKAPGLVPDNDNDTVPFLAHNLILQIRHTNGYEYSNIWVELTTPQPDTLKVDTFNIELADVYGHWYGSGVGVGYQRVDTVLHDVWLIPNQPILLRHIMRADTLRGIEQAGITISDR